MRNWVNSSVFSSESNLMTHLELKHDVSFLKNSNVIDIEKNPIITDNITQKLNINNTLKAPASI